MRTMFLILLAALPIAFITADSAIGGDAVIGPTVGGTIKREPVLVFDVTGSTLTGPLHSRYSVYNDGLVTGGSCGGFSGSNEAGTAFASPADVAQLAADLIAAGGLTLADQTFSVSDVPLTTVTVLKGATNARAHTFSYWLAIGEHSQIGSVISSFQAKYPVACQGISTTE